MELDYLVDNGGRFISRGRGKHAARKINSWELIFVVEGKLEMFVADRDFDICKDSRLLIPPGTSHGGRAKYSPRLSFFWIHFTPGGAAAEQTLRNNPPLCRIENPGRLSDYFQLFLSLQENDPADRTGLNLIFSLIMHEASKADAARREIPESVPRLIHEASNIMTLRFREPISTSFIARELKCNPDYLGRLYRRHCGRCIVDALNDIRLRHAAELLFRSNLNIGQIAEEVGFCDPAYFRRCFFQKYARTPREFRRQKLMGHLNTE